MGTNEDRNVSREAARSVAGRTGGTTRYGRAMQRYLSAESFATHTDAAPQGWADKPEHPEAASTHKSIDS